MTRSRRALIYSSLLIATTAAAYLVGESNLGNQLELRLYDLRFRLRGAIPAASQAPVTIIAIDEDSLKQISTPLKIWHRHFARLVETLTDAEAAAIAVDFIFADVAQLDIEGQQQLSQALLHAADSGVPVVLAYEVRENGVEQPPDAIRLPALALGHAFGFINLTTDRDDFVRRQQLFDDETQPSFALAAVRAFEQKMKAPARAQPEQIPLINYRSPAGFPRVSFASVLDAGNRRDAEFLRNQFRGRIVLVGRVGREGEEDLHSTPFYYWATGVPGATRRTPGIEIHANTISTILDGRQIRPVTTTQLLVATALTAAIAIAACGFLNPVAAASLTTAALLVFAYLAMYWTFARDTWMPLIPPMAAGIIAFGLTETANYLLEGREKRYLRAVFKSYVNDNVIERILRDPSGLSLVGERKHIAVLFADIKNFTTWAENASPEMVVECLCVYFEAMVAAIQSHHGMVDKFMGDGIMAVFGAPLEDADVCRHAVEAARSMQTALARVNTKLKSKMERPIEIGIGIHSGEAVVGHVGSAAKREYTAIGDVVNTAARLESQTRKVGGGILVSGDTFLALNGKTAGEYVGEFELKGKKTLVPVYRIT